MAVYFNLAHGTRALPHAADFPWPYAIDICFEQVAHPIAFSEGVGHGSAGCALSASDALGATWRAHFEITQSAWLIPYIERLAQGTPLPRDDMMRFYAGLHGRQPACYQSAYS